ncbi:glucosaminidase domain-containing protein [Candidatus Desulfosporosinus nitrosoreducens]
MLAQWGDESGWGTSQLATKFNNFGGIKVPGTNTYESYSSPSAWA